MRISIPIAAALLVFSPACPDSSPPLQAGTERALTGEDMVWVNEATNAVLNILDPDVSGVVKYGERQT